MPEELEPEAATQEVTPPVAEAEGQAEAKAEGTTPEIDWKARAEKAENDLRSLQGSRKRQEDINLSLQEMRSEVALLRKNQQATVKAVTSGESDGLTAEMAQNEAQGGQAREDMAFQRTYTTFWNQLERAVMDKSGEPLFDAEVARRNCLAKYGPEAKDFTPAQAVFLGAPELESVVDAWTQAAPQGYKTGAAERNLAGLAEAVAKAHEVMRDTQAQRHEQALAKVKKSQAGALDLSSGRETGGKGPAGVIRGEIKESQITPEFWEANKAEILRAQTEGRIRIGE